MYHNNSDRHLVDVYQEQLKEQAMFEGKKLQEEMGYSTNKTITTIDNQLAKFKNKLEDYEENLKNDPERFKMFVKNIKAEHAKIAAAKLATMDVEKALKKLEAAFTDMQGDF